MAANIVDWSDTYGVDDAVGLAFDIDTEVDRRIHAENVKGAKP